ncbi:CpsB/CapC family capsule biosynthesis tyrosine phosphatase [Anaerostipes faecalis]|uniref:CpsB/CapC family capsule biosynthesis tyrosine phosphatase n=1 Tax=Anaerostipes faecalis TaxID=2738446 RepID=UPI003F123AEC
MGVTDIHTHILYGVDDGAECLGDSMKLIGEEWDQGVRRIFLTPHYGPKFGRPDRKILEERFHEIKEETQKYYPDMELYLGSELYYQKDTIQDLKDGKALTMAGTRYVLIEFETGDSYSRIFKAVQDMVYAGFSPVIAHAERYEAILGHMDRAEELVKMGAYLQVNAGSFLGGFLDKKASFCKKLLKEQLVCFIGSDCHDMGRRCPDMKEGFRFIQKKFGDCNFENHVDKVLEGKYI